MSRGTGGLASAFALQQTHQADGSRLVFDFRDDSVEVTLWLMEAVELAQPASAAALVMVSTCVVSSADPWSDQGFALRGGSQTAGASAFVVSQGLGESGGALPDARRAGPACTLSLEPDTFVIVARGPAGADGRPRTITLHHGARQESIIELEAATHSPLLDTRALAEATIPPPGRGSSPTDVGARSTAPTVLHITVAADETLQLRLLGDGADALVSAVSLVELAERARAARARDPRTHAVLVVDPTVPYGAVDAVVDALRVGGVTRFSLSRPAP
ncbi:MAG: biopolymer transporter ExbD [Polyangiales bacterium]